VIFPGRLPDNFNRVANLIFFSHYLHLHCGQGAVSFPDFLCGDTFVTQSSTVKSALLNIQVQKPPASALKCIHCIGTDWSLFSIKFATKPQFKAKARVRQIVIAIAALVFDCLCYLCLILSPLPLSIK